jgi:hypothetical protein
MNTIKRENVRETIKGIKRGKIFSVTFVKKDGSIRVISTMNGTTKGVTGRGMSYEPSERGLLPMYDLKEAKKTKDPKKSWRMINVETVKEIKVEGNVWIID